jgi:hypothetical protein
MLQNNSVEQAANEMLKIGFKGDFLKSHPDAPAIQVESAYAAWEKSGTFPIYRAVCKCFVIAGIAIKHLTIGGVLAAAGIYFGLDKAFIGLIGL